MADAKVMKDVGNRPPRRKREEVPFTWYVASGMPTYSALSGVRFDRIFQESDAIIEAYSVGHPKAVEIFGPDVRYGGPGWAGISYGHVNCLGSQLTFPKDSEVAHKPIYSSLAEGIEALQQNVDWASAGMMPFYLDLWQKLKDAFPDKDISFGGFGLEGPITTAWELRGHDFFTDPYDDPERCKEFLHLVTESIVDYAKFIRSLNGQPAFADSGSLYDDVASMFSPHTWPEFLLPFHEQFFKAQTSGRRRAHIENLTTAHLRFLDDLGLDTFDPGVTPGLKATDLR
ncbi:MAG: uroporphyrinogen decarboxylase family protein, partial [Candidatus Latescibacteria bacterium]|nr:uroporphyrinogen decarboxylase family protein [Candidatus Latescibacterota bacterium]